MSLSGKPSSARRPAATAIGSRSSADGISPVRTTSMKARVGDAADHRPDDRVEVARELRVERFPAEGHGHVLYLNTTIGAEIWRRAPVRRSRLCRNMRGHGSL